MDPSKRKKIMKMNLQEFAALGWWTGPIAHEESENKLLHLPGKEEKSENVHSFFR